MTLTAEPVSDSLEYLLSGVIWNVTPGTPISLTYDFLTQVPAVLLPTPAGDPTEDTGWAPLTATEQTMVVQALAAISSVANITFKSSSDAATSNILFGTDNQVTSQAFTAYGPGDYLSDGRFLLSQQAHIELSNNESYFQGQYLGAVFHELANATGLDDFAIEPSVPASINSLSYSVESYFGPLGSAYAAYSPGGDEPATPQILDILAWQYLYGANQNGYTASVLGTTETHTGNNHTYSFTDQTSPLTVWIGANVSGLNSFDFSQCTGKVTIDLTPGTLSSTGEDPAGTTFIATYGGTPVDLSNAPYQNVGIAFGTTIQIGIANNQAATLYADATTGHDDLLIGGTGADTFVAGDGTDICVGKGGADVAVFHDPYADYKIVTGADGGLIVADQAASPSDGTMILVGSFSSLEFADQTISTTSEASPTGTITDTVVNLSAQLDSIEAFVTAGYIQQIALADSGVPTLSVTAVQLTSDAAALAAITTPYALSVQAGATSVTVTGPGKGIATTVVLPNPADQYQISDGAGGTLILTDGAVTDILHNVTALQFSDYTVFVASQTPVLAGGVSSAQITALYAGALGREPDAAGLAFYENAAATNSSVGIVGYGEYFLSSPEYTNNSAHNYAETEAGDEQFITDTYNNLLDRAPEAGAVQWYETNVIAPMLQGLTPGTKAYASAELQAHATVLAYFTQSAEFLGDVTVVGLSSVSKSHWLISS